MNILKQFKEGTILNFDFSEKTGFLDNGVDDDYLEFSIDIDDYDAYLYIGSHRFSYWTVDREIPCREHADYILEKMVEIEEEFAEIDDENQKDLAQKNHDLI